MPYSRVSRIQDQKETRRLILAIIGIVAIIAFVLLFGLNVLIGFSVLVDKIKGNSPTSPTQNQTIILPPTLDPPAESTNTATIAIAGKGQPNTTLILYVNNTEFKKLPVPESGIFTIPSIPLTVGKNSVSAKLTDDKGTLSELSNIVQVTYGNTPPKLTISAPVDAITTSGDPSTIAVMGLTDDNVTVTINDRLVVIKSDNTFTYNFPLSDGDNTLTIIATDAAGNQTKVIRHVTYHH